MKHKIDLVLFPFEFFVFINPSEDELSKFSLEFELDFELEVKEERKGLATFPSGTTYVNKRMKFGFIIFNDLDNSAFSNSVIAHESYHMATFILRDCMNIPQSEETEEVYAYVIQYIVEQITNNNGNN